MTLKENFKHPNVEIQTEATNAFEAYLRSYFSGSVDPESPLVSEIMSLFKPSQSDDSINVTRGMNMALGVLSDTLLKDDKLGIGKTLVETLLANCLPKGKDTDDAETRK